MSAPPAAKLRRRFVEVTELEELKKLPADLERWGYYRELAENELEHSIWIRYGEGLVFWLQATDTDGPNGLTYHICIAPELRSGLNARTVFMCADLIGDLLEADYLRALLPEDATVLRGYLVRLGWKEDDRGAIRRLGG